MRPREPYDRRIPPLADKYCVEIPKSFTQTAFSPLSSLVGELFRDDPLLAFKEGLLEEIEKRADDTRRRMMIQPSVRVGKSTLEAIYNRHMADHVQVQVMPRFNVSDIPQGVYDVDTTKRVRSDMADAMAYAMQGQILYGKRPMFMVVDDVCVRDDSSVIRPLSVELSPKLDLWEDF